MQSEAIELLQDISIWKILVIVTSILLVVKTLKPLFAFANGTRKQYEMLQKQCEEMKKISKQMEHNNNGTLSILRYRIRRECQKALFQNYITIEVLEDLTKMCKAYKDLGGNGSIERMYKTAIKLQIRKETYK